jgi:hypothetical protein
MNLVKESKVTLALNQSPVGTTTLAGSTLDTSGFDGVMFIATFGTVTDGTPGLKCQQGALVGGGDAADIAGSLTSPAVSNSVVVLDIFRPTNRYVTPVVLRGGATGSIVGSVVAIMYKGSKAPTTQPVSVAVAKQLVSPALGTP